MSTPAPSAPAASALSIHDDGTSLTLEAAGTELARYVYSPAVPPNESPRPYLDALRTLAGNEASAFRPWDHRWHHGLSLALPYVDATNLWGGPTWIRAERAYRQLDNNGTMRSRSIEAAAAAPDHATIAEELDWLDASGRLLATERRALEFRVAAADWQVTWTSRITNRLDRELVFGSPATHGRADAGYAGIFLRAPRSFTGARVFTDQDAVGATGEQQLGTRSRWMAFVGDHDVVDASTTLLMIDGTSGEAEPTQWFSRSVEYPGFGPAPFFSHEKRLAPGESFELSCRLVVADGAQSPAWLADRSLA